MWGAGGAVEEDGGSEGPGVGGGRVLVPSDSHKLQMKVCQLCAASCLSH